ncbi:MAG TPA: hypothetical protein VEX15_16075 [Nocardioidaceae bacterium]|nr:hypothetical protein [Nocardioidaceae bacterium]
MATTVLGLGVLATPADAAAPTARLRNGTVTVTGTAVRDVVDISMSHDRLRVDFGFDATIDARFSMSRVQRLSVQLAGGNDGTAVIGTGVSDVPITISGGGGDDGLGVLSTEDPLVAGDAPVTIAGNDGNDSLGATVPGPATVNAGAGDDGVDGGGRAVGPETISLGDGNDRFVSSLDSFLRHISEVVDGGSGQDMLETRGTFASESLALSPSAGHLIVTHDFGDKIDADNIEDVTWTGFGGLDETGSGDAVAVNDLTGTDVVRFAPDFTDPLDNTGPNNSADTLTVRGTAGVDNITVSSSGANITVAGLTPLVTAVNLQTRDVLLPDVLRIDTLASRDTVDSSGLQSGLVQLLVL